MKKIEIILLSLLIIFAFAARLYKINRPIADWHSWRQADTAAVARNFVKEGFNPFVPKYDDMSTQANGLDNPNRYRFVEFPVYNSLIALVWFITGINETYARVTTALITLGSAMILYLIVKRYSGRKIAFLSAFFFSFLPYNVFYSSTILPGPLMVFFLLSAYYTFEIWIKNEKNWLFYLASLIFTSLAILTWPIALMFMLPLLYLAFDKFKAQLFKQSSLWIFAFFAVAPFAAWRFWETRFPEGIPNWQFLLNEGNIRYKGAFFRWIFAERLGKLILTSAGIPLLVLGLIKKPSREKYFYFSLLASSATYLIVFASGNVRHDYYQVPIIPTLAIFLALGTNTLLNAPQNFSRFVARIIAGVLILFIFAFGYYEIRGFYWINKPQIIKAGQAADRLLPKDATVLAPYNGDAALLYQTNRHGYPITDRSLEKFLTQGTKYLVSVDVGDAGIQNLAKNCKVIDQTPDYFIIEMFTECIGK